MFCVYSWTLYPISSLSICACIFIRFSATILIFTTYETFLDLVVLPKWFLRSYGLSGSPGVSWLYRSIHHVQCLLHPWLVIRNCIAIDHLLSSFLSSIFRGVFCWNALLVWGAHWPRPDFRCYLTKSPTNNSHSISHEVCVPLLFLSLNVMNIFF